MLSISDHVEFVKRQIEFHARSSQKIRERVEADPESPGSKRAAERLPMHERLLKAHELLLDAMLNDIRRSELPAEAGATANTDLFADELLDSLLKNPTSIGPSNLTDLPKDLLQQLQISDSDRFQWDVVGLINRTPDKTISIDVLLIALYRLTGKVYDRTDLANRMYRLGRKGVVFGVSGKKGWYTTAPQSDGVEELDFSAQEDSETQT